MSSQTTALVDLLLVLVILWVLFRGLRWLCQGIYALLARIIKDDGWVFTGGLLICLAIFAWNVALPKINQAIEFAEPYCSHQEHFEECNGVFHPPLPDPVNHPHPINPASLNQR